MAQLFRHRVAPSRLGSRGQPEESRAAILQPRQKSLPSLVFRSSHRRHAREAHVNKALLYYYFTDKETLYGAVLDNTFSGMKENVSGCSIASCLRRKDYGVRWSILRFHCFEPDLPKLMQREMMRAREGRSEHIDRLVTTYFQPIYRRVDEVLRKGIAAGEFRKVDPAHFVPSMVAMIVFYFSSAPVMKRIVGFNPLTRSASPSGALRFSILFLRLCFNLGATPAEEYVNECSQRFFILLSVIFVIAAVYYFFSVDHSKDLVLIGTVDSNQVIVSAQWKGASRNSGG